MTGFAIDWLDLREPADHAARNPDLLRAFADALPTDACITDLGSGTGSTLRALSPSLHRARWRLTDHDPALLAEARRRAPEASVEQVDLARDLDAALAPESDAVTASALIDLVSRDWIERFAKAARGRIIYVALTYDGDEQWSPVHPDDTAVLRAFHTDQHSDKGFGPALGPDAATILAEVLSDGWDVQVAPSPWRLSRAADGALMDALAAGISDAAGSAADRWRLAKRDACTVGHLDILALPRR